MSLSALHPGLAYGAGTAAEDLTSGQFVKLTGEDLFGKITGAVDKAFGVVLRDVKAGEYVTVYTRGGVYETELFDAGIVAGEELEINPVTAGLMKLGTGTVVAQAIAVSTSTLKFKLLI